MKLSLVTTKIEPHAMNFAYCMDLVGCKFSHIPLPLATIAALTPDDVRVEILDENIETIPENIDADIVAITGILCQKERTFALADRCRQQGKTVVIGGPIADDLPDECQQHADVVFIGEAEYTWPKFIQEYRGGQHQQRYHQTDWVDMKDSPVPRFDLLKANRYSAGCLQVTRGCPYRCDFCDVPAKNGGFPRSKPIANVLKEIEALSKLGYDSIFIVDDHFAGNRKFAKDLLLAIAEFLPTLPTKMYFYTQVTLNIAKDDELLELFNKASFRRLFIGVETDNEQQLLDMNKKQNTELSVRDAIRKIQSYGITVWAGILFGLDKDDPQFYDEQFQFIMESGITPVQIGLLQAMPDTPLYEKIQQQGRLRILPNVMGASGLGDNKTFFASNIEPQTINEKQRNKLFAEALKKIYAPQAYAERIINAEKYIRNRSYKTWPVLDMFHIKAVARTLFYYLFKADFATKKMFLKIIGSFLTGKTNNLDELVFHIIIYKHLRTFYYNLADTIAASETL